MFKTKPSDRVVDARLSIRNIEDNLCFSRHEVWAWYVLPTQPWAFRSDSQREQLMFGFGDALAWLAGHRIHLRVTTRPYPTAEWARGLHQLTPDPLETEGVKPWTEHMVTIQKHLRNQTMAEKEVFLGVRVSSRAATHRAIGALWRHPGNVEHARLLPQIERITETVALPGLEGRPASAKEMEWLLRRSMGLGLPAPADLSPLSTGEWTSDDLHSFADQVEYEAEPLGRTVKLTSRSASEPVERHVAVMSVGRLEEIEAPDPGHEPWLSHTDRLPFPVEWSCQFDVLTGVDARKAISATLRRCGQRGYRDQIATACFNDAAAWGDVSLCLYDVTPLYFEAEKEDDLRKVGYSKERRVDPQVVVGLLVDRRGFPLEIGCFEGNKAETLTMIPIIKQFQERHDIADMVVVADAGMLSASNLKELDEANLRFIVGSRVTKAPVDLESHFHWHGDAFTDGQIIDTITPKNRRVIENDTKLKREPVWDPEQHPESWRAVWAYSAKRAARDGKTLTLQENRAREVVGGEKTARTPRFVRTINGTRSLDEASLTRARRLVGLKGYVTNIPTDVMDPDEVIGSYHDLWRVEQSFRMSKTDLRARPMFHHKRESIEAHLTIVFAALAVARYLQQRTGVSIKKLVQTLRPLQDVTVTLAGQTITARPQIPADLQELLDRVAH